MSSKVSTDELLAKEMDQARAGTHQRQKGEEKRLLALKGTRIRRAEHLRQLRVDQVEAQFEAVRREVSDARRGANAQALTTACHSSLTPPSLVCRLCVGGRRVQSRKVRTAGPFVSGGGGEAAALVVQGGGHEQHPCDDKALPPDEGRHRRCQLKAN